MVFAGNGAVSSPQIHQKAPVPRLSASHLQEEGQSRTGSNPDRHIFPSPVGVKDLLPGLLIIQCDQFSLTFKSWYDFFVFNIFFERSLLCSLRVHLLN